jgi:tRNA threonylcarbamoyladenosine biosynthesis protein TsaB
MKILAFDTTAGACSAAVLGADGAVLAHRREILVRGHAEILMPMVREVLSAAAFDVAALDLLAVTTGPGAFTGIRIGLAAARGLALASGRPLVGVTSLEAVAASVPPAERAGRALLVAIDSRRGDFFVEIFDAAGRTLVAAGAVAPGNLSRMAPSGDFLLAGDAALRAAEILTASGRTVAFAGDCGPPDAVAVARLARIRWPADRPRSVPQPTYLRAPDVTLPTPSSRRVPP